ncbi:MAG: hypothetical protein HY547_04070 [Elusimicrobia bacterium]|nr:hypothetical protein [Elusimicrobiota bacterium]
MIRWIFSTDNKKSSKFQVPSSKFLGLTRNRSFVSRYLGRATFQTFVVDPPTMLAFGIGVVLLAAKFFKGNKKFILGACVLFQLLFWICGPMMYFDAPFFADQGTGNDFMWNGYLMGFRVVPESAIPTYRSPIHNAIAVISWLIQPLFLYWGVKLGWQLARRFKLASSQN